ncbi:TIM barrel protein [Micromonospora sp. NPDC049559]|uniref:hydroxypyruvate isomerase family protein n=1 Tax=Micromonospora sp. NPDC049559 TaxID=3155923 RepID=UPI00343A12F6
MTEHGLRYDVNLSILFTELPLLRRPAAAAEAGFDAVEFWWPFATPTPPDGEVTAFLRALDDAGVRLVGLNFDAGDMPAGDRGLLSQPPHSARFRDNIDVAVGIAESTGCRALNALYGNRLDGVDPRAQDELAAENLALAAKAAGGIGAVVLVEPLNSAENPAYPLRTAADVFEVIDRARAQGDQDNLRLLLDLYHLARNGEDLAGVIAAHAGRVGHVQVADVPGRNQPGTGSLDVDGLLAQLERAGYAGYVGCEYKPLGPSADSFGWLPRQRRASTRN